MRMKFTLYFQRRQEMTNKEKELIRNIEDRIYVWTQVDLKSSEVFNDKYRKNLVSFIECLIKHVE